MNVYLAVTGAVFCLLVVVHVWRVVEEGSHLARDPWYILTTAIAAGLSVWAWRLLWVARGRKR